MHFIYLISWALLPNIFYFFRGCNFISIEEANTRFALSPNQTRDHHSETQHRYPYVLTAFSPPDPAKKQCNKTVSDQHWANANKCSWDRALTVCSWYPLLGGSITQYYNLTSNTDRFKYKLKVVRDKGKYILMYYYNLHKINEVLNTAKF